MIRDVIRSMLNAPLLIGCDLSKMDPLTVSLFSNDEVLAVDQDALGKQGHRLKVEGTTEGWIKPLKSNLGAVALFNRGKTTADSAVSFADLISARGDHNDFADLRSVSVRDLWRRKPLEIVGDKKPEITFHVAPHSAELLKISVHEAIL